MVDSSQPRSTPPISKPKSRWFRNLLIVMVLGAMGVAFFYAEENWRGKRAWEKYKSEQMAKGETFDWKGNQTPVPADQNFTQTPLLVAVGMRPMKDSNAWTRFANLPYGQQKGDWSEGTMTDLQGFQESVRRDSNPNLAPLPQEPAADVLACFRPVDAQLEELRTASQRPYAQFYVTGDDLISAPTPNFVALRIFSQIFSLHASAELALGHSEKAFQDAYVMNRFIASLKGHPMLVSTMIRVAIAGLSLQSFWEGLVTDQWSDQQLEAFQKLFQEMNLLADVDNSLRRGERGAMNQWIEGSSRKDLGAHFSPFKIMPRGWIYQNQLFYNRLMEETFFSIYDSRQDRIYPEKARGGGEAIEKAAGGKSPFRYLAAIAIPNFTKAFQNAAKNQTSVTQAMLACALERHRRVLKQYPEKLEALVPRFIEKLPHDVIGGQPLRYQRTADGKYSLYSIGWNEKDDGGNEQDDWVWSVPIAKNN